MHFRRSSPADADPIKTLYLAAFPEGEAETVASVAVDLLAEASDSETVSLVAESDDVIIGHIAFSPVSDAAADRFLGYILAPLAVHPDDQKQRIGTRLIEHGMRELSELAVDIVFVYGDPNYYGRFGFQSDGSHRYVPPHPLQFPDGWLSKPLADAGTFASSGELTCVPPLRRSDIW